MSEKYTFRISFLFHEIYKKEVFNITPAIIIKSMEQIPSSEADIL
jgi:hypothetical protein